MAPLLTSGMPAGLLKALPFLFSLTGFAFIILCYPAHLPSAIPVQVRNQLQTRSFLPSSSPRPAWHDFARIQHHSKTSSATNVVAPLLLRHLEEFKAPAPFEVVHVISSWVDTRPLIVDAPVALTLVATMQGAPYIQVSNGSRFEDNPLYCFVAMKKPGQAAKYLVSKSIVNGLPDVHELERHFVAVQFDCPLVVGDGEAADWRGWEIYVTLSMREMEPPLDVFSPATPLPEIDLERHIQGHGDTAVCLPPLTGEIYAPFIKDFVTYYRALGFTTFYTYLFSPGPETLNVLREISSVEGIRPIRWGPPKSWTWSATKNHVPSRNFPVDPMDWNLPGIGLLPPEQEYELSGNTNGEFDILLWYLGQGAAAQDCKMRAMKDGMRWVAHLDWDEYLLLRPAGGGSWPPPATDAGGSHFTEWARTAQQLWTYPETLNYHTSVDLGVDVAEASRGTLPASFTFISGFACLACHPTSAPPDDLTVVNDVHRRWPDLDWLDPGFGLPMVFSSPVRQERWFGQSRRTKFVVDPWAWWSVGIHMTGLGYAEHEVTRGVCSSSWTFKKAGRSEEDSDCARKLLSTLGRNTILVRAAPPVISSSPPPSEYGQGSIFHYRVAKKMSAALVAFNKEADKEALDAISGPESSLALNVHRVDKAQWAQNFMEDMGLVQDWSMVDVMGPAILMETLSRKQRYGASTWPLDRPGMVSSSGAGLALVLAFAFTGVALWRSMKRTGDLSI